MSGKAVTVLGDICTVVDCEHKTAPSTERGIALIRTPNIGKGRLILDDAYRVTEQTYAAWTRRARPEAGDLIMAREAPVGNVGLIQPGQRVCLGQRTVLLRLKDKRRTAPAFVSYLMNSPAVNSYVNLLSNGATVGHLNVGDIRRLALPLFPRFETQEKVAGMLAAYDDLIENNRRRIALLERMAEQLYREWFVCFRFPDYRRTNIQKGVPAGWHVRKLPTLAVIAYGFPFAGNRFNANGLGKPIVRIRNVPTASTSDFTDELVSDKYLIQSGDLLIGMDGEFHMNHWHGDEAYLVQRVCRIRARKPELRAYLYWALRAPIKHLEATIVGATVAHLGAKHLNAIDLLVPEGAAQAALQPLNDLLDQKLALARINDQLTQTRDLLLPRLISGKLRVDDLDIRFPPSMQAERA